MKTFKIEYPNTETWFICWDDIRKEIKSFSSMQPEQCMETKWVEVDYYTEYQKWVDVLLDNEINPFSENQE